MKKTMKKQGFTLVEIMIVVAIIGLLAAIGIPSFQKARATTLQKSAINNARLVIGAVEQYYMENGIANNASDVDQDDYINYIKNGTDGLQVGAEPVKDVAAAGTDTPGALAAELYDNIF
ncbi:type II secretion system protein [Pontiella agarivorans]|uniref:Type II secretion system protein n=1 Tax=Pontiella agarivorans TaxID=3038953 RepID=A0ABU5MYV4_9BACT|nr:type II secretion system protein [Pontiella agarivorans]MDZ8119382.1 type II secretion system protein [Pontiella agarivorans]